MRRVKISLLRCMLLIALAAVSLRIYLHLAESDTAQSLTVG
jgi:hypothetical protein